LELAANHYPGDEEYITTEELISVNFNEIELEEYNSVPEEKLRILMIMRDDHKFPHSFRLQGGSEGVCITRWRLKFIHLICSSKLS
jgi:hypothetical protein